MPTNPLPEPPTVKQCRAAQAELRAIAGTLHISDRRQLQHNIANLADFFRACEGLAHYVYDPPAKKAAG